MDRETFIKLAPQYYVAAIIRYILNTAEPLSEEALLQFYAVRPPAMLEIPGVGDESRVDCEALRQEALARLVKLGALEILDDSFGPDLWQVGAGLDSVVAELRANMTGPLYRAELAPNPHNWLIDALENINDEVLELEITEEDFVRKPIDQWEPIKFDEASPTAKSAIQKLENAVEAIETDNGYAATYPEERAMVVHDIKAGSEKLKSGTISVQWLRRTVDALKIAAGRFASNVKQQSIDGALAAIKEFAKAHVSHALDVILSWFT